MTDDFERIWQARLAGTLDSALGEAARRQILTGGDALSDATPRPDVIRWTRAMLKRLESAAGRENAGRLLSECACHYPSAGLADVRARFLETGRVSEAHQRLQAKFESFLANDLGLEPDLRQEIIARGWGLAGVLRGQTILATKMPKSGSVREYFAERDTRRRRALYCHCPRVRQAPLLREKLPRTYCACGAGFYKDIWEHILGQPVRVEVRSSVLAGDDTCAIAIHLPESMNKGAGS